MFFLDVFIYAEIVEIHGEGPSSFVTLDIKGTAVVKAKLLDVYHFPAFIAKGICREVALFHGVPSESNVKIEATGEAEQVFDEPDDKFNKSLEEILKDVTKLMEEQYQKFKDDEGGWKKFVKRLYLKWHPDKNPNHQEKATEVTKHIQNETKRIERGETSVGAQGGGPGGFNDFQWEDIFREFNRHAHSQRTYRENYYRDYKSNYRRDEEGFKRRYSSHSNFNVPPSFQKNDLRAARRWLKEAKHDIEAAKTTLNNDHCKYAAYSSRMVISTFFYVLLYIFFTFLI